MARIGGVSAARNSGKLRGNQVFSDGDDAANNYSGGGHRQDAKDPFSPPHLPERVSKEAARPSVVPSVQRVNRPNAQLTRTIRCPQSSLRSMSHKLDILQAGPGPS
jgi:hypothetical protein